MESQMTIGRIRLQIRDGHTSRPIYDMYSTKFEWGEWWLGHVAYEPAAKKIDNWTVRVQPIITLEDTEDILLVLKKLNEIE